MVRCIVFVMIIGSGLALAPGVAEAGLFEDLMANLRSKHRTTGKPGKKTVTNESLALRTAGILGTKKAVPATLQPRKRSVFSPFVPGRTTTNKPKFQKPQTFKFSKPNLPKPNRR